jgi:hypothetical protein
MTACEISPLIDEAARAAVLVVDRDIAGVAPIGSGAASKVVLRGVDVFISYTSKDQARTKIDLLEQYLQTAIKSFIDMAAMPECVFDTSFPQLLVQSKQQHWFHFDCHGKPDRPTQPDYDLAPFDRGLMMCKYQLALAAQTRSLHESCAVWENEHFEPRRHLLIGQAGGGETPREYLVLVQNALRSERRRFRHWPVHSKPGILKLHGGCNDLAEHPDANRQAWHEYLLCVVPLDEHWIAAKETLTQAMNMRRQLPAALASNQSDLAPGEEAEDDAPWLSLTHYAEIFLGDGARKRVLDAHLQGKREASGKEQADPGKA